jgi:hypothetical protein
MLPSASTIVCWSNQRLLVGLYRPAAAAAATAADAAAAVAAAGGLAAAAAAPSPHHSRLTRNDQQLVQTLPA